jgi:hypothetical protein
MDICLGKANRSRMDKLVSRILGECQVLKRLGAMRISLKKFISDDSGAITVDWVVVKAGVIAQAVGVGYSMGIGDPEFFEIDAEQNELDMVYLHWAETNGYLEAPKRSLIGSLTRTIRVKIILFNACLGRGLNYNGHNILGDDPDTAAFYCEML